MEAGGSATGSQSTVGPVLGTIHTIPEEDDVEEVEDEHAPVSIITPTTSKKDSSKKSTSAVRTPDQDIVKVISGRSQEISQLQERVSAVLTQSEDPKLAEKLNWGQWLRSCCAQVSDSQWVEFRETTYRIMCQYVPPTTIASAPVRASTAAPTPVVDTPVFRHAQQPVRSATSVPSVPSVPSVTYTHTAPASQPQQQSQSYGYQQPPYVQNYPPSYGQSYSQPGHSGTVYSSAPEQQSGTATYHQLQPMQSSSTSTASAGQVTQGGSGNGSSARYLNISTPSLPAHDTSTILSPFSDATMTLLQEDSTMH